MAKKSPTKRAFDWLTYSKPVRLLTAEQEIAFTEGILAPVLEWALADPRTRFEIRARAAGLYHRGVSICRIMGEEPYAAEFEPAEAAAPERLPLVDASSVVTLIDRLAAARAGADALADAARNHRSFASAIAAGNAGSDLSSDALIVVDADYSLGRRKLDLVALMRTEGVTGPGGFANPELAFVDARVPGQSLTGPAGLASAADDLAGFAKALAGEHVHRAAAEITELVAQKVRLGLLPAELDVRAVSETLPHLLVAFAEQDPTPATSDPAIIELHERLSSRHYPTRLLSFVHFTEVPEDGDGLSLEEGDAMDYRTFKAYRHEGR